MLDFAGVRPTVDPAARCAAVESDLTIVGIGGGILPVGFGLLPYECSVGTPYRGTRAELIELIEPARHGAVSAYVEKFPLEQAPDVYDRQHHGRINGRAVLVPGA
ncbi:hypothetical protein GTZ85_13940 [Streptomyces sp. SID5474]|nr:hypothetical protein [Embleya scabrispora]MYS81283.1 hypothetical protein [Streptomyces sp. SID5474]